MSGYTGPTSTRPAGAAAAGSNAAGAGWPTPPQGQMHPNRLEEYYGGMNEGRWQPQGQGQSQQYQQLQQQQPYPHQQPTASYPNYASAQTPQGRGTGQRPWPYPQPSQGSSSYHQQGHPQSQQQQQQRLQPQQQYGYPQYGQQYPQASSNQPYQQPQSHQQPWASASTVTPAAAYAASHGQSRPPPLESPLPNPHDAGYRYPQQNQSPQQQQQQQSPTSPPVPQHPRHYHQPYTSDVASPDSGTSGQAGQNPAQPQPHPEPPRDADLEAALEASRSSAAAEEERRRQDQARQEEEELQRVMEHSRRNEEERAKKEEEELQRIMEQSRRNEEERRIKEEEEMNRIMAQSRADEEARQREAKAREERALEEARISAEQETARRQKEAEERQRQEEEEMQRVMEQSLREEWERRKEAEEAEVRIVERMRREIEEERERRLNAPGPSRVTLDYTGPQLPAEVTANVANPGSSTNAGSATGSGASRRPLPSLPPVHSSSSSAAPERPRTPLPTPSQGFPSQEDSDAYDGIVADSEWNEQGNPFSDAAEAPPAYENVGDDKPPEAPARAPAGFWEASRSQPVENIPPQSDTELGSASQVQHSADESSNAAASSSGSTSRPLPQPMAPLARINAAEEKRQLQARDSGFLISNPDVSRSSSQNTALPVPPPSEPQQPPPHEAATASEMAPQQEVVAEPQLPPSRALSMASSTSRLSSTPAPSRLRRESGNTQSTSDTFRSRTKWAGQSTPTGVDWGYADAPFAMRLRPGPREHFYTRGNDSNTDGADGTTESEHPLRYEDDQSVIKERFPDLIALGKYGSSGDKRRSDRTGGSTSLYFMIRCGSWRLLLRTLAWLGNTRIEPGPEEAADAASEGRIPLLRVDVEFVTPTQSSIHRSGGSKLSTAEKYGLDEYTLGQSMESIVVKAKQRLSNRSITFVSVCISLISQDAKTGQVYAQLPAPNGAALSTSSKSQNPFTDPAIMSERELDMHYMQRGSARRVISLPPSVMGLGPSASTHSLTYQTNPAQVRREIKAGLPLPTTLIRLAEHLQQAHRFSAACPSSGYTARHSPRDLYHTIEAHDDKYIGKVQTSARQATTLAQGAANASSNPNQSALQEVRLPMPFSAAYSGGPPLLLWEGAFSSSAVNSNGSPLLGSSDPSEVSSSSASAWNPLFATSLGQPSDDRDGGGGGGGGVRERVKRKLRGRAGDVGEQADLVNWITPLDLNDVA